MLMHWLQRLVVSAAAVALGATAFQRFGFVTALLAVLAASFALAGLGALVLSRAKVGEVTWRNRLAAWLLPYGALFGSYTLGGLALTSGGMLATFAAIGVAARGNAPLGAAWGLDVLAFASLAAAALQHGPGSSGRRSLLVPLAALLGLAAASVACAAAGRPTLAAAVAAGPLLALAALYGVFVLLMVTVGRNARWN